MGPGILFALSLALCLLCQDLIISQLCKTQVAQQHDGGPAIGTQDYFFFWFTSFIILSTCSFFQYASN